MAQDRGQRLDVHSVLQGVCGEGMPQIMETRLPAPCVLQQQPETMTDDRRADGHTPLFRRREHPSGGVMLLISDYHSCFK